MIIVSSFNKIRNSVTGHISVFSREKIFCPFCDGELVYRDSRKRRVKDFLGNITIYLLRRLYCKSCKKLHTEIPDTIQPFKHYDSATIQSTIDGDETAPECAADNSTIRRWKTSFEKAAPDMGRRLVSVYARKTDAKIPIAVAERILDGIKSKHKHWLAFVTKLLINAGYKICTQFAFCPNVIPCKIRGISESEDKGGEENDKTIKDSS